MHCEVNIIASFFYLHSRGNRYVGDLDRLELYEDGEAVMLYEREAV